MRPRRELGRLFGSTPILHAHRQHNSGVSMRIGAGQIRLLPIRVITDRYESKRDQL